MQSNQQRTVYWSTKNLLSVALLVFAGLTAFEGIEKSSRAEILVAAAIGISSWILRNDKLLPVFNVKKPRVFWSFMLSAYVLGYFAFMDRHSPTFNLGVYKFQSSFRWAPRVWIDKAETPYLSPWRDSTIWNILYKPMDLVWFSLFPRSKEELDALHKLGY